MGYEPGLFDRAPLSSTVRTASHSFYEKLGYTNIKTQYAFVKSLATQREEDLKRFVPRVDS